MLYTLTLCLYSSGTFREDVKGEALTSCTACTMGYYCPDAQMTDPLPCGIGNYSDSGAIVCSSCEPGHYCNLDATGITTMETDLICPAGVECLGGISVQPDLETYPCRVGHYCPRGNINPLPVPCPIGTFNAKLGREQVSHCEDCTAGYYCNQEGLNATEGVCPEGYYCPRGTGDPNTNPCPVGFYRRGSSRESFQDCTQCMAGFYCDSEGLADPIDCPRGTYYVNTPMHFSIPK